MATETRVHKCPENGCRAEGCPLDDEFCESAWHAPGGTPWCIKRCNPERVEV